MASISSKLTGVLWRRRAFLEEPDTLLNKVTFPIRVDAVLALKAAIMRGFGMASEGHKRSNEKRLY